MSTFRDRINLLYEEARDRNYRIGRKGFAEQLGVSLGKVSAWIDGNGRPDFETLKLIAKNANVSVSWLIGETNLRNTILPQDSDHLPIEAQEEYKYLLNYIKAKYDSN